MYTFLIILMLLFPMPLYILYRRQFEKKGSKAAELKKAITQLSKKHNLSIDEVEIFNGKVIGLDKKDGKILLVEYVNSSLRKICISLKELESHRITKALDKIEGCISKVAMEFNLRGRKPVYFNFYDNAKDHTSAFSFLRDKAKYWDAKIHFHANEYGSIDKLEYVV
jgi:hypothetical protein